jgi:two-component system cell cycle response regulator DivK
MATILIVEDEKSTAALLKRALTDAGHKVTAAANGGDAVEAAKNRMPDLILMDMSLPKMNGYEATRRIKADAATKHIPVLGLSGATTGEDRNEAHEAGCEAYMTKPINFPLLLKRVAELTSK